MRHHLITRSELMLTQVALLVAIGLQLLTRHVGSDVLPGSQNIVIIIELVLALLIGLTVNRHRSKKWGIYHLFALVLLAMISFANIVGLGYVLYSLIVAHDALTGTELLMAGIAIFLTNIIVYALWYWEIDSPGLTRTLWSKYDKDFQFTQQDLEKEFPDWQPQFGDYLYLSVINAINFAPADSKPLTRQAKFLMASQSLVSVFTLALLIARSVSILS